MVPIDSLFDFYLTSSYLSPVLEYLTCKFDDLELGLFKVIQGQRSWCQL